MLSIFFKYTCLFIGFYSLSLYANDSIKQLKSQLQQKIEHSRPLVLRKLSEQKANDQISDFSSIVKQIESYLNTEEHSKLVQNNPAFQEYSNLVKNHLLHISLGQKIEAFKNLLYMYPHDMAFSHTGPFPALPTWNVLRKVEVYLKVIESQQALPTINFEDIRLITINNFIDNIFPRLTLNEKASFLQSLQVFYKLTSEKESTSGYLRRFKQSLANKNQAFIKKSLLAIDSHFYKQEQELVRYISNKPKAAYNNFSSRVQRHGQQVHFPELLPLVEKLLLAVNTSMDVEEALKLEPRLEIYRSEILESLLSIKQKQQLPYRMTLVEIVRATEFLDIVQRTIKPAESNPLHYAKRYEYYMHYVLNLAPKHITIPSSVELTTYDLLSISGVPIGFAGIALENLWVDSYNQTPNEFTLHDLANHERRRYQFTKNYAARLGIPEKNFYSFVLELNQQASTVILPMIKRIDLKDLQKIHLDTSAKNIVTQLKNFIPGDQYFFRQLQNLEIQLQKKSASLSLLENWAKGINSKKALYDTIFFEVIHEDASPPSSKLVIESILRPPNQPMPRDFIDLGTRTAMHSMEPAGTTPAYILEKVNGSFYDTPQKRLEAFLSPEYRSPKKIIEATVEFIEHLGGYNSLSKSDILKKVVFLTLTEDGFLRYLVEEFQRDLHPIQRSLIRSLKFAEGLESLTLIDEFKSDIRFETYIKLIRKRIELSQHLGVDSSNSEVNKVLDSFKELAKDYNYTYEELDKRFFKIGQEINEKLYHEVSLSEKHNDRYQKLNIKKMESLIKEKLEQRSSAIGSLGSGHSHQAFSDIENLSFEIESLKASIIKKRTDLEFTKRSAEYSVVFKNLDLRFLDKEALSKELADKFHNEGWLPNFRQNHGVNSKFRNIPKSALKSGESAENALKRLEAEGFIGLRINPDGKLQQNINQYSSRLHPSLHEKLSKSVAKQYIDLIYKRVSEAQSIDENLIRQIATEIHDVWMKNNYTKIETAFKKIGLNVYDYKLPQLLDIIKSLDTDQLSKLSPSDIKATKQFVPSTKLSTRERRNDINMCLTILESMAHQINLNQFTATYKDRWNHFSSEKIEKNRIIQQVAKNMHDKIWLPYFRAQYGEVPRYKELPASTSLSGESLADTLNRLNQAGYKKLRVVSKSIQQDINQDSTSIVPSLLATLTLSTAKLYTEYIIQAMETNPDLRSENLESIAAKIHSLWMQSNSWQLKSAFSKLGLNIESMNQEQIIGTIKSMEKSTWLKMSSAEIEKLYQFTATKDLAWSEHKKNFLVAFNIIESILNRSYKANKCSSVFTP